jgi:hypothetical protein
VWFYFRFGFRADLFSQQVKWHIPKIAETPTVSHGGVTISGGMSQSGESSHEPNI